MITEDYVSIETAKLLNEKGFDEDSWFHYDADGDVVTHGYRLNMPEDIPAWTLQMAMKWLREVHKLGVFPSTYAIIIGSSTTHVYGTAIVNLNTYELMTSDLMVRDTYNEACEAAIKYCLENLI